MKILIFILAIIFLQSCIEDGMIIPDEVQQLESILPEGWLTGMTTEYIPSSTIVEGLESPDVVVVFVNRETTFNNLDANAHQYPSLVLNFFNIDKIEEIDSIMRRHVSVTGCSATPYDTTDQYFILSSPCFQNHGFRSEEADELVSELHESLHNYFDK